MRYERLGLSLFGAIALMIVVIAVATIWLFLTNPVTVATAVTDGEITCAYRFLAEREGVFAEPASAAAVAGVMKLAERNYFQPGSRLVITLTGAGLKDPDFALSFDETVKVIEPTLHAVREVIEP